MRAITTITLALFVTAFAIIMSYNRFAHHSDMHHSIAEVKTAIERSAYFQGMNSTDIRVRGCPSSEVCMQRYMDSLSLPAAPDQAYLDKLTSRVDHVLNQMGFHRLANVPWNLVFFGATQESGYPHTHGVYIMLPDNFLKRHQITDEERIDTLLHEKIHVFQRLFPSETLRLYSAWDLELVGILDNNAPHMATRSNPDKNRLLFRHKNEGAPILATFKDGATGLSDIQDPRDHPNEMMAYKLTHLVLTHHIDPSSDEALVAWAKKYA